MLSSCMTPTMTEFGIWLPPQASLDLKIDEVHVWQACLDVDDASLQQLERVLSADEKERASRFHFERDRKRFVAGRATLRNLLSRYLRIQAEQIQFSYGTEGKPAHWFSAVSLAVAKSVSTWKKFVLVSSPKTWLKVVFHPWKYLHGVPFPSINKPILSSRAGRAKKLTSKQ